MTQQEYENAVQTRLQEEQERYTQEVAEARASADAAWRQQLPELRAKLIAQAKANIDAQMTSEMQPLPAEEKAVQLDAATAEIDAQLQKQHEEQLQMAVSVVQLPETEAQVRRLYAFLRPQDVSDIQSDAGAGSGIYEKIWHVGSSYWNIAEAKFVAEPEDKSNVVELGGPPTVQNLKENVLYYASLDPRIKLGSELMDTGEKLASLRLERDKRLAEHDNKIAQLTRAAREGEDVATQLAAWDAYAIALCELPDQPGSPWDGGGPETPWPKKPA